MVALGKGGQRTWGEEAAARSCLYVKRKGALLKLPHPNCSLPLYCLSLCSCKLSIVQVPKKRDECFQTCLCSVVVLWSLLALCLGLSAAKRCWDNLLQHSIWALPLELPPTSLSQFFSLSPWRIQGLGIALATSAPLLMDDRSFLTKLVNFVRNGGGELSLEGGYFAWLPSYDAFTFLPPRGTRHSLFPNLLGVIEYLSSK